MKNSLTKRNVIIAAGGVAAGILLYSWAQSRGGIKKAIFGLYGEEKKAMKESFLSLMQSIDGVPVISDNELKKCEKNGNVALVAEPSREGYGTGFGLGYYPHVLYSRLNAVHPSFWMGSGLRLHHMPIHHIGSRRYFWRRNGSRYYAIF